MLRPAAREVQFRVHGTPPRRPTSRPAFGSNAAQTVPENPADAATEPPQRPVPLILLRAWTSSGRTPHLRAGAWNVAILSSLFCALTKGKRRESQSESIAGPHPVAKLPTAFRALQSLRVSA